MRDTAKEWKSGHLEIEDWSWDGPQLRLPDGN
jgi:hypothetical protein